MENLTETPTVIDDEEAFKDIMIKMIDIWMVKYGISVYELEAYNDHECERCDH